MVVATVMAAVQRGAKAAVAMEVAVTEEEERAAVVAHLEVAVVRAVGCRNRCSRCQDGKSSTRCQVRRRRNRRPACRYRCRHTEAERGLAVVVAVVMGWAAAAMGAAAGAAVAVPAADVAVAWASIRGGRILS